MYNSKVQSGDGHGIRLIDWYFIIAVDGGPRS